MKTDYSGKYKELCSQAREAADGEGAVLFVLNGKEGTGFSVHGTLAMHEKVRDVLEVMVAGVRGDVAILARNAKYENMRALLEELRSARPLLLYGDAWLARIETVLGMPDE
jgi:hypothetical protein